jgi:tetratricopeptide (TPR) repeat protein
LIGIEIAEGKFEQAVTRCGKLKSAASQLGDNQLLASVHTDLGIANFYLGQLDQALASFREAHRLYTVSGNLAKTVDASINSGNVLSAKGDYRGALVEGIQALDESRKLGNSNQQAQILNNLGIAHYHVREYEQAGARYEEALAIFLDMNSTSGLALARLNLGEVALALSHYEKALDHWNIALHLYEEMNDPAGTADAALHLARVHVIVENVSQLDSLIEQARTVSTAAELQEFDADIQYLEGQRRLLTGNPGLARESLCAAVKLFAKRDLDGAGDKEKTLRASIDFARTLMILGDREKATASLNEIEGSVGDFPLLSGEFRLLMGICRENDAMNQYKLGLAAIADLDVSETTWKLMYALGQELSRRGNSLKAREHIERARMVLRYLAEQFHSPELRAQYLNGKARAPVLSDSVRVEPARQ